MLCINAVGITTVVGMLDEGLHYPKNLGIAISVFSCAGAVFLFFLMKRYMETITHRFYKIDPERIESISKIAKRFFVPFTLFISLDIVLAVLGVGTLLFDLARQL